MLDSCWTRAGLCLAIVVGKRYKHFHMCWTHVGLVLDSCWTRVGLCVDLFSVQLLCEFLNSCWTHVGFMLDRCWAPLTGFWYQN